MICRVNFGPVVFSQIILSFGPFPSSQAHSHLTQKAYSEGLPFDTTTSKEQPQAADGEPTKDKEINMILAGRGGSRP